VIGSRVAAVRERITRAAARAGRPAESITLIAVSKTQPADSVREAFAAGLRHFGENKVQEAEGKVAALGDLRAEGLRWHMIGHVQSNKGRRAAELFDAVDSIDDATLARRLERGAEQAGRHLPVLVQVDLGNEDTKFGVDEEHLYPLLEQLRSYKAIRVEGLMAIPPLSEDPEASRPFFRRLRELLEQARASDLVLGSALSMGMSHDLEVAVEEGATQVRVGTAIFGERKKALD
jgi:pyridoxal phosphate enzyme (YggS family)